MCVQIIIYYIMSITGTISISFLGSPKSIQLVYTAGRASFFSPLVSEIRQASSYADAAEYKTAQQHGSFLVCCMGAKMMQSSTLFSYSVGERCTYSGA